MLVGSRRLVAPQAPPPSAERAVRGSDARHAIDLHAERAPVQAQAEGDDLPRLESADRVGAAQLCPVGEPPQLDLTAAQELCGVACGRDAARVAPQPARHGQRAVQAAELHLGGDEDVAVRAAVQGGGQMLRICSEFASGTGKLPSNSEAVAVVIIRSAHVAQGIRVDL